MLYLRLLPSFFETIRARYFSDEENASSDPVTFQQTPTESQPFAAPTAHPASVPFISWTCFLILVILIAVLALLLFRYRNLRRDLDRIARLPTSREDGYPSDSHDD